MKQFEMPPVWTMTWLLFFGSLIHSKADEGCRRKQSNLFVVIKQKVAEEINCAAVLS
jgi:hypothetical protein